MAEETSEDLALEALLTDEALSLAVYRLAIMQRPHLNTMSNKARMAFLGLMNSADYQRLSGSDFALLARAGLAEAFSSSTAEAQGLASYYLSNLSDLTSQASGVATINATAFNTVTSDAGYDALVTDRASNLGYELHRTFDKDQARHITVSRISDIVARVPRDLHFQAVENGTAPARADGAVGVQSVTRGASACSFCKSMQLKTGGRNIRKRNTKIGLYHRLCGCGPLAQPLDIAPYQPSWVGDFEQRVADEKAKREGLQQQVGVNADGKRIWTAGDKKGTLLGKADIKSLLTSDKAILNAIRL